MFTRDQKLCKVDVDISCGFCEHRFKNVVLRKLDLTTFFLYLSKITSNLPENYLSRSKTTSEKSYSSKK